MDGPSVTDRVSLADQVRCDELLREFWRELMNDASDVARAEAKGGIRAMRHLGWINDVEVDGWMRRLDRCPDTDHEGGRAWCAYCGDVNPDSEPLEWAGA